MNIHGKRVPGRGSQGTECWTYSSHRRWVKSEGSEVGKESTNVSRRFGLYSKCNRKSLKDFKQGSDI